MCCGDHCCMLRVPNINASVCQEMQDICFILANSMYKHQQNASVFGSWETLQGWPKIFWTLLSFSDFKKVARFSARLGSVEEANASVTPGRQPVCVFQCQPTYSTSARDRYLCMLCVWSVLRSESTKCSDSLLSVCVFLF